jgi:hypothetical protein
VPAPESLERLLQDPRIWQAGRPVTAAAATLATGWPSLDRALGGGWPLGQLTELLVDACGMGELSLLLPALAGLTQPPARPGGEAGWIALVAPPYMPYAPPLARAGLDLSRVLVVHARRDLDTLWAIEQALQSRSCTAVLGWSGSSDEGALRRLQLAAGASSAWTVLFRDARFRAASSPAPLRIRVARGATPNRLSLGILKRRGGPPAEAGVHVDR